MNCEIIHCRYLKDFVHDVPVCRQCMINTVRRICMTDDWNFYSYEEVDSVLQGESKNLRIYASLKFFMKHPDGFVRMENAFFKERGYEPEQYI